VGYNGVEAQFNARFPQTPRWSLDGIQGQTSPGRIKMKNPLSQEFRAYPIGRSAVLTVILGMTCAVIFGLQVNTHAQDAIDKEPVVVWERTYGIHEEIYDAKMTTDGHTIALARNLDENIHLIRFNNVGDIVWDKLFGGG